MPRANERRTNRTEPERTGPNQPRAGNLSRLCSSVLTHSCRNVWDIYLNSWARKDSSHSIPNSNCILNIAWQTLPFYFPGGKIGVSERANERNWSKQKWGEVRREWAKQTKSGIEEGKKKSFSPSLSFCFLFFALACFILSACFFSWVCHGTFSSNLYSVPWFCP